jgi:hypothetical protein
LTPTAATSVSTKGSLRFVLYRIDPAQRLPARRRSRKKLARDYARALLTRPEGMPYRVILFAVSEKFPGTPPLTTATLARWEAQLVRERIKIPERQP